jgi:hypothetical protein
MERIYNDQPEQPLERITCASLQEEMLHIINVNTETLEQFQRCIYTFNPIGDQILSTKEVDQKQENGILNRLSDSINIIGKQSARFIMGLDVSTSTIGISIFSENGELYKLTHISPICKNKYALKQDELLHKSYLFQSFLVDSEFTALPITKIIIEEPLIGAKGTAHVAAQLNQFAGMVFSCLRESFPDSEIFYLSVNEARQNALPELVEKGSLCWAKKMPSNICGRKIKDYRKMAVWGQITQRFPEVIWNLNTRLFIDKKNFDKADSMIVAIGWMRKNNYWDIKPISLEQTIDIMERYFAYEDEGFMLDKDKSLTPDQKRKIKGELFKEKYVLDKDVKFFD